MSLRIGPGYLYLVADDGRPEQHTQTNNDQIQQMHAERWRERNIARCPGYFGWCEAQE